MVVEMILFEFPELMVDIIMRLEVVFRALRREEPLYVCHFWLQPVRRVAVHE